MALDDVWYDFFESSRIFWEGHFDDIPQQPGVYAWFYPLKVTKEDLGEQIEEFNTVHLFHPKSEGPPRYEFTGDFHWDRIKVELAVERGDSEYRAKHQATWDNLRKEEEEFLRFREIMLRASLSTPPLYVGKAKNLRDRCKQHLYDSKKSAFRQKYTKFAKEKGLSWQAVSDLILVVNIVDDVRTDIQGVEDLLEAIVMAASRPPYGQQL